MTAAARRVWVVGVDEQGRELARQRLPHGGDPERVLRHGGWEVRDALGAAVGLAADGLPADGLPGGRMPGGSGHGDTIAGEAEQSDTEASDPVPIELTFLVAPGDSSGLAASLDPVPPARGPEWDPGLVPDPGEVAAPVQRVAAYGLVSSTRGVLLTQYSDRTNAEGLWGLPGGGLDPDETPEAAMRREVAEETGQQLDRVSFLGVRSRHWIGRAPGGRLEDFHGIALLYRAEVLAPTDPVVHDIGGTTAAAIWMAREQVSTLPISPTWTPVLTAWLGW